MRRKLALQKGQSAMDTADETGNQFFPYKQENYAKQSLLSQVKLTHVLMEVFLCDNLVNSFYHVIKPFPQHKSLLVM